MIRIIGLTLAIALVAPAASAEQYWIAYEGDVWPEEQGWHHGYGDWEGHYHGGAFRSLEGGILTIDSLHDEGVFDGYIMEMPGQIDPEPGELFIMEWRLKVDETIDGRDPTVALASDQKWMVGFEWDEQSLISVFEDGVNLAITPHVFHDYRLVSWDMLTYELYIDESLVREGSFWSSASESYVAWGDGVQGAASLSHWDYFRFGAVPEPASVWLITALLVCRGGGRA